MMGPKKRRFTRWTSEQTASVVSYFANWIETTDTGGLPRKKEIMEFLKLNSYITVNWMTVRNKVLNERMAFSRRRKDALDELKID